MTKKHELVLEKVLGEVTPNKKEIDEILIFLSDHLLNLNIRLIADDFEKIPNIGLRPKESTFTSTLFHTLVPKFS